MRMNADGTQFVPWNKGLKLPSPSEETRAKLRDKRKGKKPTLGMKFGEETRRKHSEIAKRLGLRPPSAKGLTRSPETRKRMSDAQKMAGYMQYAAGASAPNWQGGIAPINRKARNLYAQRKWRKAVRERDNSTCRHCGANGVPMHTHHLKGFAQYPELRFEVDNGLTLCIPCHRAADRLTAQTPAT